MSSSKTQFRHSRVCPVAMIVSLLFFSVMVIAWGCQSVPISGRRQLVFVSEQKEIRLGAAAFQEILKSEPASTNQRYIDIVNRVGRRLAAVAGRDDYEWEFHVIASATPNAFCLPGGKVAFYEGILPICQNEAGVAVVMSHEIAHAIARHGGERMSHEMAVKGAESLLRIGTDGRIEREKQELLLQAYGFASKYGVILPYSRKHESESDSIGLTLMAKAGYDPTEAPRFWERFAATKSSQATPEFLSTHPSDAHRAAELRSLLPDALHLYALAKRKYGLGEPVIATQPQSKATTAGFAKPVAP